MKSLGFVFKYAKRYKGPLGLTVASMLLLVGIQLLAPWLIKTMIATVTDPAAGSEAVGVVARLALLALAAFVLRAGLQFIRSYMAHVAGWNVVADVRAEIYEHLQRLSLRFYEDRQTGQLMSRTVNDSDLLEQLIAHAIPDVLVNVCAGEILCGECKKELVERLNKFLEEHRKKREKAKDVIEKFRIKR